MKDSKLTIKVKQSSNVWKKVREEQITGELKIRNSSGGCCAGDQGEIPGGGVQPAREGRRQSKGGQEGEQRERWDNIPDLHLSILEIKVVHLF